MTKREKRLQDLRRKIARRERDREQGIKLLVKAVTELPSLRRQLDRLERGWHPRTVARTEQVMAQAEGFLKGHDLAPEPEDDGLDIPEKFLRRGMAAQAAVNAAIDAAVPGERHGIATNDRSALAPEVYEAAHAVANKHNRPPTPEQTKLVEKEKRKVREEVKQAELTGKRRKWPATGRHAIGVILDKALSK